MHHHPAVWFVGFGFSRQFCGYPEIHFVDYVSLKLTKIFLPLPLVCWDQSRVPPCPALCLIFKSQFGDFDLKFSRNRTWPAVKLTREDWKLKALV